MMWMMAHVGFATQLITLAMSIASGFGTLSSTLVSFASMHDFGPSFACDNMTIPIQFNHRHYIFLYSYYTAQKVIAPQNHMAFSVMTEGIWQQ
jgi:hypothetical protein